MTLRDRADLWKRHRKWTRRLREIERADGKERTRHKNAIEAYAKQAARCHAALAEIEADIAGLAAGPH